MNFLHCVHETTHAEHHMDTDHRTSESSTWDSTWSTTEKEILKTISHRYISARIISTICRREKERGFNFTDPHRSKEFTHSQLGSAAEKSEDLEHNFNHVPHTLAYLTYQFRLNGNHSTHIPEQISEMKVGNLNKRRLKWERGGALFHEHLIRHS